jgi:hypothetical protein
MAVSGFFSLALVANPGCKMRSSGAEIGAKEMTNELRSGWSAGGSFSSR